MAKRALQEINAGSMADIAFLLLIFFLVTTTMDVDSGIARKLPPFVPEDEIEDDPDQKVKERNVFIVLINRNNDLLVEGSPMHITQLCEKTKEFYWNPAGDDNLAFTEMEEDPILGTYKKSMGVVSLQNDRGTSYGTYIAAQNELTRAFNEMREEVSMSKFGKKYDDLGDDRQKAVRKAVPLAISEAEPRNVGGGNQ